MKPIFRILDVLLIALLSACGGQPNDQTTAPLPASLVAIRTATRAEAAQQPSVALFSGKFSDYSITKTDAGYAVVDQAGTTVVTSAKTLQFADDSVSLESAGTAARLYRLYQAAFDREADLAGMGFYISLVDGSGVSLNAIARDFIASAEFQQKFGNTDNAQFTTLLYNNVLHRAPDPEGLQYWVGLLNVGSVTREQILSSFSESAENVAAVSARTVNGIVYLPYPRAGTGTAFELNGGKLAWGAPRAAAIVLRDGYGVEVPAGHLTCASADEPKLSISADCRTATGRILGTYTVSVSGDGVTASLPVKVIPPRRALATGGSAYDDGGGDYNVVVTSAGNVLAWGANGLGVLGQGVGPSVLPSSSLPLLVKTASGAPLANVVSASAGNVNVLALTEDGTVQVWGGGDAHLGFGDWQPAPATVPAPTGSGALSHIVQVAAGDDNAAALTDEGTVFSWHYYTGQGTADMRRFPNYVLDPTGQHPLANIVSVAAGSYYTLALGSDGKVYGWGWYQGARGNPTASQTLPATVKLATDGSELTGVVAISAGDNFALALTKDGRVYAFGDNSDGQLGQNVRYGSFPGAVLVKDATGSGALSGIVMVAAGGWHALALDASGQVFSWGEASDGQLGDGANRLATDYNKPLPVVGPSSTLRLGGIAAIAAGYYHSLALATDGTLYIWGSGYAGDLGQGSTGTKPVAYPLAVKNPAGTGNLSLGTLSAYADLVGVGP
jgi:alpha-tubulin suppressor-like RCC1 family protein